MAKREFYFKTKVEAEAYSEGVAWVNDGAVELVEMVRPSNKDREWKLVYEDRDATE